MLIFALALAAPQPATMTDVQQRDIACVGVMGLIAADQRRQAEGYDLYPDVQERGKIWAGIVGERVMEETGLPKEVVGLAMTEAAKDEQNRLATADEPRSVAMNRFLECQPLMDADLAAPIKIVEAESFPGVEWGTDEPDKLLAMREQLISDLKDQEQFVYCFTTLSAARNEIVGREGSDSRDAKAFDRLMFGMKMHMAMFPLPEPGSDSKKLDEAAAKARNEPVGEERMARCIRVGQALAARYDADEQ